MKVQVFVITLILAIIPTSVFPAVAVPERTDVSNKLAPQAVLNKEYKLEYFAKIGSMHGCGMKLASITSQGEQDTVEKLINEYGMADTNIWIAGSDIATEGRFNWFTSGEIFRYTNWGPNEPNNNGTENCVEIRGGIHSQKWNDKLCTTLNYYLCEDTFECS